MNTSDSITKIASAYVQFTGKVGKIAKDASNPFHKNKYATLDQIIDEVRPMLHEHKMAVMQNVSGDNGNVTVKTMLLHESGEWMESDGTTLSPQKQDPQGAGGAVTYARRYDLCAFLSLNTGEDDDGNKASGHNGQNNQNGSQNGSYQATKTTLKSKWETLNNGSDEGFEEWYNKQKQSYNENQMNSYLTKKLKERGA